MNSQQDKKPEISYPCEWDYKIIGRDEAAVRAAVKACLPDGDYSLAVSRASAGGKYVSLNLTTNVADEVHRNALFAALAGHMDIKMVI